LVLLGVLCVFNYYLDHFLFISAHLNPFVLHGLAEANLGDLGSDTGFNLGLESLLSEDKALDVLLFGGTIGSIASSFLAQLNAP